MHWHFHSNRQKQLATIFLQTICFGNFFRQVLRIEAIFSKFASYRVTILLKECLLGTFPKFLELAILGKIFIRRVILNVKA